MLAVVIICLALAFLYARSQPRSFVNNQEFWDAIEFWAILIGGGVALAGLRMGGGALLWGGLAAMSAMPIYGLIARMRR